MRDSSFSLVRQMSATFSTQPARNIHGLKLQIPSPSVNPMGGVSPSVRQYGLDVPLTGQSSALKSPVVDTLRKLAEGWGLKTQQSAQGKKEYTLSFDSFQEFSARTGLIDKLIVHGVLLPSDPSSSSQVLQKDWQQNAFKNLWEQATNPPYSFKFSSKDEYCVKRDMLNSVFKLKEGKFGTGMQTDQSQTLNLHADDGCCIVM